MFLSLFALSFKSFCLFPVFSHFIFPPFPPFFSPKGLPPLHQPVGAAGPDAASAQPHLELFMKNVENIFLGMIDCRPQIRSPEFRSAKGGLKKKKNISVRKEGRGGKEGKIRGEEKIRGKREGEAARIRPSGFSRGIWEFWGAAAAPSPSPGGSRGGQAGRGRGCGSFHPSKSPSKSTARVSPRAIIYP